MHGELTKGKADAWWTTIGWTLRRDKYVAQGFDLGARREVAVARAVKLLQLWKTQNVAWTDEALKEARRILRRAV